MQNVIFSEFLGSNFTVVIEKFWKRVIKVMFSTERFERLSDEEHGKHECYKSS